ncbi:cortactin-binding protein 2-like isoform X1 [Haliotis rufescens]|uniref:cortactin-binding protein 2-like isoform X1 n=1 Tax=Haliotis rufescens TaxID=6454 RepID=UPI00201F3710|nr:cortactin-binding protein 2-like isoform X1 [Haliotis rufescens]
MASRNVNPISGLDPSDKLQSNTLKRQPNPDWSKNDLLRLLSYFEGELQARDVTIAALRAEKAKNLLFQAKYGRFGLGDPFIALQRDSENMKDNSFDEPAIKSMYDNQLAQLENLIATQRKAQLKMREQLASAEKRYHKVVAELEDEKRKHAQDTAQGDDVTYMLEKERERLKQEVDFEKGQTKRMEKDLKKTLASLEEERANSAKHKQVALMLIKERKRLMERVFSERSKTSQFEQILGEEKDRVMNMAEGLVQESKKSLKMEAAMEKQLSEFDVEREQLRSKLGREENRNKELQATIDSLSQQIDSSQKQMHVMMERSAARDTVQSIEIKSSVTPPSRGSNSGTASPIFVASPGPKPVPKTAKPGSIDSRSNTSSPERDFIARPDSGPRKPVAYGSPNVSSTSLERIDSRGEQRLAPVGASAAERAADGSPVHRVNIPPGSSATVVTPSGGKISLHVGGGGSPRKVMPTGRGAPPPIPPNKPILNPGTPGPKPAPPPKVGLSMSKDRVSVSGAEVGSGEHSSRITASQKAVQIPVNVVGGQNVAPGSRTTSRDSSPMRKTTQLMPGQAFQSAGIVSPPTPALDFLGPEMADLQQLLATMTKGEASPSDSFSLTLPVSAPSPSSTCTVDIVKNSPVHKHAACGDLDLLKTLIVERDADVNLPMKDGTTPIHCTAEGGHEHCLQFLLDKGGNPNALRDDLLSPVHLAAANGHTSCLKLLLNKAAVVNIGNQTNETPLHLAATRGHDECCRLLLEHGARPLVTNMSGLTPLHTAVIGSHIGCLRLILQHSIKRQGIMADSEDQTESLQHVVSVADKGGWTLAHMAACLEKEDCLQLLMEHTNLDLEKKDRLGRSAFSVASKLCKDYLNQTGSNNNHIISVIVELHVPKMAPSESDPDSHHHYMIGTVEVTPFLNWCTLEEKCCSLLESYYTTLDTGLRTRKINRLEPESPTDNSGYTLGLSTSSIKHFKISYYEWSPGSPCDKLPFEIVCNNTSNTLSITLSSSEDTSVSVAFDTLYPLSTIRNYLRLLEQYKSVVFYGPAGSGKSYLTERLAQCIATSERAAGREPQILSLSLQSGFSNFDFISFLKQSGCIVPIEHSTEGKSPILLLENMEKVNIAQLFGKLLDPIEYRGKTYAFRLKAGSVSDIDDDSDSYYLPDNFYLLATMNRTRSTGLDLCIQQRFRWIHFRLDSEPFRNHLARYIHRRLLHLYGGRLPSPDKPVFRCAEWVICLWQRLNDSLTKLGLPDLAFGPCLFFQCPLEQLSQEAVLQWVKGMWNELIAPQVRDAVKRGTGSETASDGQQKVANTALYVLVQRSIVLGCPLTGKDKEDYMSGFSGSNELDIPLKIEKRRSFGSPMNGKDQKQGADNSTNDKASRVEIITSSGVRLRNKNRNVEESFETGLSNSKRRSLSESCVDQASRLAEESLEADPLASQPKMPKLEIRSPTLMALSQSSPSSSFDHSANHSSGRVSPLFSGQRQFSSPMAAKKSRSSENISSSTIYSYAAKRRSASPFSFSLTTPTSSLNSFKFLEVTSPRSPSSPSLNLSPEPVVFTASPREKSPSIKSPSKTRDGTEKHPGNGHAHPKQNKKRSS